HLAPRLPSPLLAVAGGIVASVLLDLKSAGVAVVGHIPGGLPPLVRPDPSLLETLWPAAVAMALMSFTETIAASRGFTAPAAPGPEPGARRHGRGERRGGSVRSDAGWRRDLADGSQPEGRSPHAGRGPGHRRGHARDAPLPRPRDRAHAPGDLGGGGDRVLRR